MEEILKTLKERRDNLKKIIKKEQKEIDKLKYKNRGVRLTNPSSPRVGWYIDHLQELELVIDFLGGGMDKKYFTNFLINDSADKLCRIVAK